MELNLQGRLRTTCFQGKSRRQSVCASVLQNLVRQTGFEPVHLSTTNQDYPLSYTFQSAGTAPASDNQFLSVLLEPESIDHHSF